MKFYDLVADGDATSTSTSWEALECRRPPKFESKEVRESVLATITLDNREDYFAISR